MVVTFFLFSLNTFAQINSDTEQNIVQIETQGKRPGPPLWQISNGINVVLIFGIPSPYHKGDLKWDRTSVRSIMAESEIFIPAPEMKMPLNPFKHALLIKAVLGIYKMPNRGKLEDVLSAETYDRFLKQKDIYMPRSNRLLKQRPQMVGHQLFATAIKKSRLVSNLNKGSRSKISKTVESIARSKGVKIISLHQAWDAKDFIEFRKAEEWDIDCLETVIDSLEQDVEGMITRSHAWADGDISAYREYNYPHVELPGREAILTIFSEYRLSSSGIS